MSHHVPTRLAARGIVRLIGIGLLVTLAMAMPPHTGPSPAFAGPQGGDVRHGQANIDTDGTRTTIDQHTHEAIIEWDRFNIGPDESVRFNQPDAQSRVLNRVIGGDLSEIAGELSATGIVYLTNPAGIIFTPGATIDVAGLYAAAGQISDADFLSATDHFRDLEGEVINHGSLVGQTIHLLGRHVRNHGTIHAEQGVVTLLAGDDILMHRIDGRVHIKIDGKNLDAPASPTNGQPSIDSPGVVNTGTIQAPQSQLTLGAGDMYALAVRNSGHIQAPGGNATFAGAAAELDTGTVEATFQRYFAPVTLKQSTTFNAISTEFAHTLDAAADADDVDVVITGPATFTHDVGAAQPLNTLTVQATTNFTSPTAGNGGNGGNGGSSGEGNNEPAPLHIHTRGDQTYAGGVNVLRDTTLLGGGDQTTATIHLADGVNADAAGQSALRIEADHVILAGRVGGFRPLRELHVAGDLITLHGSLIRTRGDILLNPAGREQIPTVATIAAPAPPDGALTLESQTGNVVMGQHEKLTVVGDLTIAAADTATLSDISTLGDMTVTADTIELRRREPGFVLESDGVEREDTGLTYVAGGRFHFSTSPTAVGAGTEPVFASPAADADANQTLPDVQMREHELTESDFFFDGMLLALRHPAPTEPINPPDNGDDNDNGNGGGDGNGDGDGDTDDGDDNGDDDGNDDEDEIDPDRRINLAEAFADEAETPAVDPVREVAEEAMLGPEAWAAMNQLALNIRPIGVEALVQRLAGRHLIDDTAPAPGPIPNVSVYRVRTEDARQALDRYFDLFIEQVRDEDTGEITLRDRTAHVRRTIDEAWRRYAEHVDAEPTVPGFRAFLEHPNQAQARHYVHGLAEVFTELRETGISPVEYAEVRDTLLRRLDTQHVTPEQLREVIRPLVLDPA